MNAKNAVTRVKGYEYNNSPRLENFIFICGLHRSGTTLLEQLLVQSFDASCLRMSVPENEGQHAQSVYAPAKNFGGPGRFAFSRELDEELDLLSNHSAHAENIVSDWSQFVVGTSTTLIEKSPPNLTKIYWLRKVFPNSKFVVLTRDPKATSGATQKWSHTSLEELMMHWNVAYSKALLQSNKHDTIWIKYEDLVSETKCTMDKIAQFSGLKKREQNAAIEPRFLAMQNSNQKYLSMHTCGFYGKGIWDELGYSV